MSMSSRSRHSAVLIIILATIDVAAVVVATVLAAFLSLPEGASRPVVHLLTENLDYTIAFLLAWPIISTSQRLYISRRRDDLLSLVFDITKCVAVALVFMGFVVAFYTRHVADARFVSFFGLSALMLIAALRVFLQIALWSVRSLGYNERQILVIGANNRTRHLVQIVRDNPHYGYRPVGILDDDKERCEVVSEFDVPHLGKFKDLEQVLTKQVVDEVYICLPVRSRYETIQKMAHLCEDAGVSVRMVADLFPLRLATSRFHNLEDIPILALSTVPENQPQLILQRATDLVAAAGLLLMLSPVFLATAIAIKLDSRGPVFFRQVRIGLNQRRFKIVKFRSMVKDAEKMRTEVEQLNVVEGAMFKAPDDPRLTRVGQFIRKYSIDEFPQLFNVLVGDMSLVGPRPPLPTEVEKYTWAQRRRLSVKPGMTGLSQVSGRSELSFEETVYLDLYYIDKWSLALVFRILFLTVPAVFKGRGAM